jgi:hypothetical protein
LPWAADVVIDPDYELIHDEQNILYLSIAGSGVDIAGTSFVGKLQECDAEIARLGLTWVSVPVDASDVPIEAQVEEGLPDYELIHDEQNILYLSIAGSGVDIAGTSFVGKLQECDAEIARLGLTWPEIPVDAPSVPIEVQVEELLTQVSEVDERRDF